jgi:hypothetical protein
MAAPVSVSRRERFELMRTAMQSQRSSFDSSWRELGDYFAPRRTRFTTSDRNRGDRRTASIIDSTARYAMRTLQSGMHAGLTSPARPWMKLSTPDPDLNEFGTVKTWLHTVTRRMLSVFQRSNLYNALPTIYGDMSVFATAAMGVLPDERDIFRAYAYPLGSFCIGMDERGVASSFIRDFTLSVRQVVEQFARIEGTRDIDRSKLSQRVLDFWDRGDYEQPIEVTWVVVPNEEYEAKVIGKHWKWASCYYERGSNQTSTVLLRESGFHSFPIVAPRWDVTGEDSYGTDSPGFTALGDNKQLQKMQLRKGQAIEKLVNPPLVGPESLRTQKVSHIPGDITYADEREGSKGLRPIHEVRVSITELVQDIAATQYRIQRAFYEDMFLMLANNNMGQPITAEEVRERHEEKLLALGPVLERTNDELLDPLIDRIFSMMGDRGLIPEPPKELVNMDLRVEYISLMAQAQKLVGVVGLDRHLASVANLTQTWPEAKHKVNINAAVDEYAEMLGVNPEVTVTTEDATAALQEEAELAERAAAAQEMQQMGAGIASLAKAPATMPGGSVLEDLAAVTGVP